MLACGPPPRHGSYDPCEKKMLEAACRRLPPKLICAQSDLGVTPHWSWQPCEKDAKSHGTGQNMSRGGPLWFCGITISVQAK